MRNMKIERGRKRKERRINDAMVVMFMHAIGIIVLVIFIVLLVHQRNGISTFVQLIL